jgi:hypothetical protein
MSQPTCPQPAGSAWQFLGGYFLLFGGWMAGFVGSIELVDAKQKVNPAEAVAGGYALIAGALVMFALGVQVIARAYWGGMKAHPESAVIFFLTPIPAVVAVAVNALGKYFRTADGTVVRALLIAVGAALAGSIGMKLADGFHLTASRESSEAYLWPLILQAGIAAVLLGLVPPARTEPDSDEALPEAIYID